MLILDINMLPLYGKSADKNVLETWQRIVKGLNKRTEKRVGHEDLFQY